MAPILQTGVTVKSSLFSWSVIRLDLLAVSAVMHVLALALPLALLQIYDRILPSQSYGTVVVLVIGVGLAIVLEALLRYGRLALFANLAARYEVATYQKALDSLLKADVAAVERRGTPAVTEALRAISTVRDFWSGQAGAALYESPFIILYLLLIAYVGGWLVLVPLFLFMFSLLLMAGLNRSLGRAAEIAENSDEQRRAFTWSALLALAEVKSSGGEGKVGSLFRRLQDQYMQDSARLDTLSGWVRENAQSISQLATVLVVAWGAVEVVNGRLTTGALAACTMLVGRALGPVIASLGYWSQLSRVRVAQAKLDELLSLPAARVEAVSDEQSARIERGGIKLVAPHLLKEPLAIRPGELVCVRSADAVVASDFLAVLAGVTQDSRIKVLIDDQPAQKIASAEYARSVALVTRHPALVPGTILENLTLFDPRLNYAVGGVCAALGLQAYIDKLRHGVLTEVGPASSEHLDEGIYQRIAIARALLRKPRILLLDHAASGLDLDGVKRLAAVLSELKGHTTVLLVTNTEALVEVCTQTLVLGGVRAPHE